MSIKQEQSHLTPLKTNELGGVQSDIKRDYTLVPATALATVARVMHNGLAKYGRDNWRNIPSTDHLNHAINHVYLHLSGNTQEDHLGHACTRMMMALEQDSEEF